MAKRERELYGCAIFVTIAGGCSRKRAKQIHPST
jgi:hypothetical protein